MSSFIFWQGIEFEPADMEKFESYWLIPTHTRTDINHVGMIDSDHTSINEGVGCTS